MKRTGIIFFAHGSKDPQWALPFEAMRVQLQTQAADIPSELAFLELMTPNFATAVERLAAQAVQHIRVVPIFLAAGKHLKQDLPQLVSVAQQTHPHLQFDVLPAIGESQLVRSAIVQIAVQGLAPTPSAR